jgi:hypothetical protein
VIWLLKKFHLPASITAWGATGRDHGLYGPKDYPGQKTLYFLHCWHGHWFSGTWQQVGQLIKMEKQGLLKPRRAGDAPRKILEVPQLQGGPFDPEICVQPWRLSTWQPKLKKIRVPKTFMEGWQIGDGAAVWQLWKRFYNECLQGVDAYCGIVKAIAK